MQQIEEDTGLNANDTWRIAHDRNLGGHYDLWPIKRSTD